MEKVYLTGITYSGQPANVFSCFAKAEENLFNYIRNMRGGGFSFSIYEVALDNRYFNVEYKYTGSVEKVANLKFIKVSIPRYPRTHEEVYIIYPVANEIDLIDKQISSISIHNPDWIYFNQRNVIKDFRRNLNFRNLDYKKIETVTIPYIKEYFRLKAYVSIIEREQNE